MMQDQDVLFAVPEEEDISQLPIIPVTVRVDRVNGKCINYVSFQIHNMSFDFQIEKCFPLNINLLLAVADLLERLGLVVSDSDPRGQDKKVVLNLGQSNLVVNLLTEVDTGVNGLSDLYHHHILYNHVQISCKMI